ADFERGADTTERMGPLRATAQGWFSAAEVKRAALFSFALAFLLGIYLAWLGGWPIVAIGSSSLIAGYAYTGGPRPIAYSGSGELFVLLFFGIVAVTGSYYLQAGTLSLNAWLTAAAIGLLAAAVLLVNNYRDLDTDRAAGKLTLVHYLGRKGAQRLYSLLLLLPFLLPLLLQPRLPGSWSVLLALPLAWYLRHRFITEEHAERFNRILAATAMLQLGFALLLALGLLLAVDLD
ncbi:MAG: 1,4-dihydroxy-2-naphthoate octaprenyltransferase, partial [Gammaproteobacteria bacterium]|nr:1,4-dihydroxy-2-naphthoate octaprenyltransferase [Gammaproteobacteria bacterium]